MSAEHSDNDGADFGGDQRAAESARGNPEYRVNLDVYSGPMDLLLYLVKRDELDIQEIPIVRVTEQYLDYVRLLEQVDPNAAGDFLVLAATLIEIKSRALLPSPPLESMDDSDDPRAVLVRQLLEYKRFKDAARALGSAADDRAMRYVRRPSELPEELQGVELEEVEVWDLLAAFNRVMSSIGKGPGIHSVKYDDTPIAMYAAEITATLERDGPTTFQGLFATARDRWEVIGLFLALLELIRQKRLRAEQNRSFSQIYLFLLDEAEMPDERPSGFADGDYERESEYAAMEDFEDDSSMGSFSTADITALAEADEEMSAEIENALRESASGGDDSLMLDPDGVERTIIIEELRGADDTVENLRAKLDKDLEKELDAEFDSDDSVNPDSAESDDDDR